MLLRRPTYRLFFFFNDTATTEIYTLSLHDALPIWGRAIVLRMEPATQSPPSGLLSLARSKPDGLRDATHRATRSEEHTSELQSPDHLVCRLLLEKKKKKSTII